MRVVRAIRAVRQPAVVLALILLAGLALRLVNIDHGLPFVYQSDEARHFTNRAVGMFGGDLDPGYYRNPSAYTYAIYVALGVEFAVRGLVDGPQNVVRNCMSDPAGVYVLARGLAAVLCMLGVGAVYFVGGRLWGAREGLAAAAVLAFAFLPVAYSRYALTDVCTLLPATIAVYGAVRARETGRPAHFALAGAATGLAVGFKYTAGLLVVAVVAAALLAPGSRPAALLGLATAAGAGLIVFLLTNPFFVVRLGDAIEQLRLQSSATDRPKLGQTDKHGAVFYLRSLTWGLGWGAALAAGAGALSELRQNRSRALLLLVFPLALLIFLSSAERFFARWLLPAYPMLALLAGVALARLARRVSRRPALQGAALVALVAAVLVQPVAADIRTARLLGRPDTRQMTWDFLVRALPYRTSVVVEPAIQRRVIHRWLRSGFNAPPKRERLGTVAARFVRTRYLGLIDRYRASGHCFVITFSNVRRRIESDPSAQVEAYYRRLERESTVIFQAIPYRDGARRPAFDLDKTLWLYYPAALENPGPEAVVYRLNRCEPAPAPQPTSVLAGPPTPRPTPDPEALVANPVTGRAAANVCRPPETQSVPTAK